MTVVLMSDEINNLLVLTGSPPEPLPDVDNLCEDTAQRMVLVLQDRMQALLARVDNAA